MRPRLFASEEDHGRVYPDPTQDASMRPRLFASEEHDGVARAAQADLLQ